MERRPLDRTQEELFQLEKYTEEELSQLTGVGVDVIRHAAFTGVLPALIVDNEVVSIRREDAINWLRNRP